MRRNGLLVGGWALATLLALVLGLQGIRSVSDSVTSPRPAPLSPASVKAALQRSSSESSSASAASTGSSQSNDATIESPSHQSSGASGIDDRGLASSSFVSPPASENSGAGDGSSSSESVQSGGDDGGSSSSGPDDDSSSLSPPVAQDKTYQLVGGSVGVRFENGAAHLLWATPNSGFSVETSNDGGTVDVRFRSDDHESRLRAYWDNGPQQEIEERADS